MIAEIPGKLEEEMSATLDVLSNVKEAATDRAFTTRLATTAKLRAGAFVFGIP